VAAGQALLRLQAPELELEQRAARMQLLQIQALLRRAESEMVADLAPLREQAAVLASTLAELHHRSEALVVRAPIAGVWVAPEVEASLGQWIPRGTALGTVVDASSFRFVAVLPQVATHLFGATIARAEIRVSGQENLNRHAERVQVIPFQHGVLPSPALGWAGGGEIAVATDDPRGLTATEPFFLIRAAFAPDPDAGPDASPDASPELVHGRSGTMRITLGSLPLLWQWERSVRQFLQQRYRI
jgi:putative peptide zinc metalloprotease protein